jgi:nitroimidazol reductase NimA-like FMN-containing flavoprotein (pyridoxamine 5'-phosphate oxidase superfamily)
VSTKMTKDEREAFLADVHVGIIAITEEGRGPMAVPVWYGYEPGGDVWFVTDRNSLKGTLLLSTSRATLTVQTEDPPYKYVMVEGPVSIADTDVERDSRPLAHRYLGQKMGDAYMAGTDHIDGILVSISPERWLTVDYSKIDITAAG